MLSFIAATPNYRTIPKISKAYLKGFFIFDVLATIPPMWMMQNDRTINWFKFLRFVHINDMF